MASPATPPRAGSSVVVLLVALNGSSCLVPSSSPSLPPRLPMVLSRHRAPASSSPSHLAASAPTHRGSSALRVSCKIQTRLLSRAAASFKILLGLLQGPPSAAARAPSSSSSGHRGLSSSERRERRPLTTWRREKR
ncbi:hypothetical protein U9M48_022152 [Paspalum notatum var. saurae]|uniref:Uncharacterized protein n=1 Tax=Paspalum notatum var. saurae TaxID=547442 RepID=A0AAQ3TKJ1_PASNO